MNLNQVWKRFWCPIKDSVAAPDNDMRSIKEKANPADSINPSEAVSNMPFFDKLVWKKDRMLLEDLVFRLEHYKSDDWELGSNCFLLYKIKFLIDQYAQFWASRPKFHPQNVIELGMWDGGSAAFWFEYFHPNKLVGVDLMCKEDNDYFRRYVASRGLCDHIKTYWKTDQADAKKLQKISKTEFSEPIDLVIDDASHIYEATKTSFETLFPLLRPGGLYVIEDWAWGHWKEYHSQDNPMSKMHDPTQLIFEFVETIGSSKGSISNLSVFQGFIVVERGEASLSEFNDFKLEEQILRRPNSSEMIS